MAPPTAGESGFRLSGALDAARPGARTQNRHRGPGVPREPPGEETQVRRGPAIGIDLGGTKVLFAVVSPEGKVLRTHRHHSPAGRAPEAIRTSIVGCLDACLGKAGRRATAIGIGVAGQIDRNGTVVTSPNLKWRSVPLREMVEAATHRPVVVTNDVRAVTFGEWRFGAGRGEADMVCVIVGTGIGGGIVAGGELRYGATETAGEVGHMTIVAGGRACHCPNTGCLEAYVGGWAIAERAREAVRSAPGPRGAWKASAGGVDAISAATVSRLARRGDALARRIVAETATFLAAGLVSIVNGFNPRVIVLGGGVIEGMPGLVPQTRTMVRKRALAVAVGPLSIVRAGLGPLGGAVGAAAMASLGVPGGI